MFAVDSEIIALEHSYMVLIRLDRVLNERLQEVSALARELVRKIQVSVMVLVHHR